MDHNDILARFVWFPLAALTGALSSLGARQWRNMSRGQMAFTVLTGFGFGYFVAPAIASGLFGIPENDVRNVCAVIWGMSFGWHVLLPVMVKRAAKLFGSETFE